MSDPATNTAPINRQLKAEIDRECAHRMEQVLARFGIRHWKATMILRGEKDGEWVLVTADDEPSIMDVVRKAMGAKPGPAPAEGDEVGEMRMDLADVFGLPTGHDTAAEVVAAAEKLFTERDDLRAQLAAAVAERDKAQAAFNALYEQMDADAARARAAGLSYQQVRDALNLHEAGDVSFDRLVEIMRVAALEMAKPQPLSADALELLLAVMNCADIYKPRNDGTRDWCPELSVYLRGNVGISALVTPDEYARIKAICAAAGSTREVEK